MKPRWPHVGVVLLLSAALTGAQTRIVPPNNKYSPQDDVKLGREAEGLDFPPYPGELGKRIFERVSKEAWKQWLEL